MREFNLNNFDFKAFNELSASEQLIVFLKLFETLDLINTTEAGNLRGVTRTAIHHLIKRGKLNAAIIAGHYFVKRKDVVEFQRGKPGPKTIY